MQAHDERVLYLAIPEIAVIRVLSAELERGLVVALGTDETVRDARRQCAELDNVMFIVATPDDIPWRSGFFSRVIDPRGDWPDPEKVAREVARVSAPVA